MNERVRAFIEVAKADPELRDRLTSMSAEEFLAAAKARGFDLTEDDLRPPEGELDDAEAANVAGGHCFCVLGGGGGGTDSNDGNTSGCACAGYGQGGHDHGQVRLDSIAGVVEDGAGSQVVLAHRRRTARACHSS